MIGTIGPFSFGSYAYIAGILQRHAESTLTDNATTHL